MATRTPRTPEQRDAKSANDLIRSVLSEHAERDRIDSEMFALRWATHYERLEIPDGTPNVAYTFSGTAEAQLDLQKGLLVGQRPVIKVGVLTENAEVKDAAETLETFHDRIYPQLEAQGGEVFDPVTEDQLAYGRGVEALWMDRTKVSEANGFRLLESYESDGEPNPTDRYKKDRQAKMRELSLQDGQLPFRHMHVPARQFWHREDPDSPLDLSLTVELRIRRVGDVLYNPRYRDNVEGLWRCIDKQADKRKQRMLDARCAFYVICDRWWVDYLILPLDVPISAASAGWTDEEFDTQTAFSAAYKTGDLAESMPNTLGRPPYIVTRGLTSNSKSPELRTRSTFYDFRKIVYAIDRFLTLRMTRLGFFVLAPVVLKREAGNPNLPGRGMGPGGQLPTFQLKPGPFMTTELPAGVSFEFVVNPGGGPDEVALLQELEKHADLLGIPRAALGQGVEVGYLLNQIQAATQLRFASVVNHIRQKAVRLARLMNRYLVDLGETIELPGAIQKDRSSAWVKIDPETVSKNTWNIQAEFAIRQTPPTAADLDNAMKAMASRLFTPEESASVFLHKENFQETQLAWDVIDAMNSPDAKKAREQRALDEMGVLIGQEQAAEQGDVSLLEMAKANPVLLGVMQQMAAPGTPLAQALMQFQQATQDQQGQQGQQGPGMPSGMAAQPPMQPALESAQGATPEQQAVAAGGAPPLGTLKPRSRTQPRAGQATTAVPGRRLQTGGLQNPQVSNAPK